MKRPVLVAALCCMAAGLSACSGSTGQPEDVTDTTARFIGKDLRANGHNNAYFYFHYCKTSQWPGCPDKTPTRGPFPGSASGDWTQDVVAGLEPNTSYKSEVCGYADGVSLRCANDVQFTTKPSTSSKIHTVRGEGLPFCVPKPPPQEGCVEDETPIEPTPEGSRALDYGGAHANIRAYPGGGYLLTEVTFQGFPPSGVIGLVSPTAQEPDGIIRRVAGGGTIYGQDTTALDARLANSEESAGLANGGILIAEWSGCRIRYVTPVQADGKRKIYTVAGNGKSYAEDNPNSPVFCASNPDPQCKRLEVGVGLSHRLCGEGGPAEQATIPRPLSVSIAREDREPVSGLTTVDFYTDAEWNRILKIKGLVLTPSGDIATSAPKPVVERVAGNGTNPRLACDPPDDPKCPQGFSGDTPKPVDGVALNSADFPKPYPGGGFVFMEGGSCRIRHVDKDGILSTIAGASPYHGTAQPPLFGHACYHAYPDQPSPNDGHPAEKAHIPDTMYFDVTSQGGLVLSSLAQHRIRYVAPPNENGRRIITTIAGRCDPPTERRCELGFDGDPARDARGARMTFGSGLALYTHPTYGNGFLFSDMSNNRVRFVETPNLVPFRK